MNKLMKIGLTATAMLALVGCRDAKIASHNISKESDQFRVTRRIVFYNAITDSYILEMTGKCSIDLERTNVLEVTCRVGYDDYQKHYLGLSDNVTYTVEHLDPTTVSSDKYEIIFKPASIVPITIDVE